VTLFVIIFVLAVLLLTGMVVDFGAKLQAGRQAAHVAEEAARAGAGRIDTDRAYSTGQFVIDPKAAAQAARAHLAASGHEGTVTPMGRRSMRVSVHISKPTLLLSLIGISEVSVTRSATADLVTGVEGPGR